MASLAGRVSAATGAFFQAHSAQAAIAVNEKWIGYRFSALSFPKSTLPAPILAWALESEKSLRSSSPLELRTDSASGSLQSQPTCLWRIGLPDRKLSGEFVTRAAAQLCNSSKSDCSRPRRDFRDPGIVSIASRGDAACDGAATATVEESTAAIQLHKEQ